METKYVYTAPLSVFQDVILGKCIINVNKMILKNTNMEEVTNGVNCE